MVAVVNGSGLGLYTSRGSNGSSGLGQTNERVYVNSTTGNLVVQHSDDYLSAIGIDINALRTYNSLGGWDGDNNDFWRIGFNQRLIITGTPGAVGSKVVKTFADGAEVTYTLSGGVYMSSEGDGAIDALSFTGSGTSVVWTWTDGSSRSRETYDYTGKILDSKDADGITLTYGYTGSLLTSVTSVSPSIADGGDGSTSVMRLIYTGTDLQRIDVSRNGGPATALTYYTYDPSHRLETVVVDLLPDNSLADNRKITTTYTYRTGTNLLESITTRGGTATAVNSTMSFTYVNVDGANRLETVTDGEGKVTRFNYSSVINSGSQITRTPTPGVLYTTENVTTEFDRINNAFSTTVYDQASYTQQASSITTQEWRSVAHSEDLRTGQVTYFEPQTTNYSRVGTLTNPVGTWVPPSSLPAAGTFISNWMLSVKMDAAGNGVAVWAESMEIKASLYSAATGQWSPAQTIDSLTAAPRRLQLDVDAQGNALVAWSQQTTAGSLETGASTIFARFFRPATGWDTTTSQIGTTVGNGPIAAKLNNGHAVVAYTSTTVGTDSKRLYVSRYTGGSWIPPSGPLSPAVTGGMGSAYDALPTLGLDASGNIAVIWYQFSASTPAFQLYEASYRVNSGSWTAPAILRQGMDMSYSANPSVDMHPAVFNSNGDGFALVWTQSGYFYSRYSMATDSWSPLTFLSTGTAGISAIDDNGNVAVVYASAATGANTVYGAVLNGSTWSTSAITSSSTGAYLMDMAINNNRPVVMWVDGNVKYASRWEQGAWTPRERIDPTATSVSSGRIAQDSNGNVVTLWSSSPSNGVLQAGRYIAPSDLRPYYAVPAGGTSLGALVSLFYGISSSDVEAQNALAPYLSGSFAAGGQLRGFPPILSVTRQVAANPPYFNVTSASWHNIVNTLYGVSSDAAAQAYAQVVTGNPNAPAPAVGTHITVLPPKLNYSQMEWVAANPPYFLVTTANWQSIANAVYAINSVYAGEALALKIAGSKTALPPAVGTQIPASQLTQLEVFTPRTVAPYFTVSAASWASIADAVYGVSSPEAVQAIALMVAGTSTAAPPAVGTVYDRDANFALRLPVITQTTVPGYYILPSGATWESICSAVYGVNDANAVTAMRTLIPNSGSLQLTAGLHLTMPAQIQYVPNNPGPTMYLQTDVVDSLGLTTRYTANSQGYITSLFTPTVGGAPIETRYGYDSRGNLLTITQDPTGLNRVTTNTYDASDNQLTTRDSAGNTVARTYTSRNQVQTETVYVVPDTGSGATSPLTTQYIYDGEDHVRFAISPTGRVTQHTYNAAGTRKETLVYTGASYTSTTYTESALNTWASGRAPVERTEYKYDFRGNLELVTRYATTDTSGVGTGVSSRTRFVYDQRGQLTTSIEARGELTTGDATDYVTSYAYDGLGRMTGKIEWLGAGSSRTTTMVYSDTTNTITTTISQTGDPSGNGLVTVTTYDKRGAVTSVVNSSVGGAVLGTTAYAYDANNRLRMVTDPMGVKTFIIYDDADRKVGEVDGDGRLVQYIYDRANQLIKTVRYSSYLPSATLTSLAAGPLSMSSLLTAIAGVSGRDAARDQITRNVYDTAGRLVYTIDGARAVRQLFYDGASRVVKAVDYSVTVNIADTADQVLPADVIIGTDANARTTRNFYDSDGLLLATLDAEGYLVENTYDKSGHLIKRYAYANLTPSAQRASGTLSALRPAADNLDVDGGDDQERDSVTRYYYDAQGRLQGELDAEGYLTETLYDVAGHVVQTSRYDTVLTATDTTAFSTLKSAAAGSVAKSAVFEYDGAGRVTRRTESIESATSVTTFAYDKLDNVTKSVAGFGSTEERISEAQYDAIGQKLKEITPVGRALIIAGMTQGQIDTLWTDYGVAYDYDLAGNIRSATRRVAGTATLLKTFYFYDNEGRLLFEVDPRGQVTEKIYNELGQLTDSIEHYRALSSATLATLTGGLINSSLTTTLRSTANAAVDAKTTFTYSKRDEVLTLTSAGGKSLTNVYTAFGQLDQSTEFISASDGSVVTKNTYDRRGLHTRVQIDPTGLNLSTQQAYDAFGNVRQITDPRSKLTKFEYDRLGRQTGQTDPLANRDRTFYDAFSRTRRTRDALMNETVYSYDNNARRMTVLTPEGVTLSTEFNVHGDTVRVINATNTTVYQYDANGALKNVSDSLGTLESRNYDSLGRAQTSTDARGTVTTFAYDASNRVLSRIVTNSTDGLSRTTSYAYDSQSRIVDVTEPGSRLTRTQYDLEGRVSKVTVDPSGLDLVTNYTYDAQDHQVLVTAGVGATITRRTRYIFDKAGRLAEQVVDPTADGGTLNLRTQYKYDANGNLTRKIEGVQLVAAQRRSTWFVYDDANRLRYSVDQLGDVIETQYDKENRIIATIGYATPVSVSGFGNIVTSVTTSGSALDQVTRTVYDRDGRAAYTIDGVGAVTQRTFDSLGNVARAISYAKPVPLGPYADSAALIAALNAAGNTAGTASAVDRVKWVAYDARGRAEFTVDSIDGTYGIVSRVTYDNADNVVQTRAFATTRLLSAATDITTLRNWATAQASDNTDQLTAFWYDGAGRQRFKLDGEGYLTEMRYNDANNVVSSFQYAVSNHGVTHGSTFANVLAASNLAANAVDAHVTISWSDAAGRQRFVLDPENYLSETRYDDTGLLQTRYVYGRQLANGELTAASTLVDAANKAASSPLTSHSDTGWTRTLFDAADRTKTITYSLNNTTEQFGYDGLSNRTSYTNQKGAVWNYAYDAVGNLKEESSPAVNLISVGNDAGFTVTAHANARVVTKMTYDAFGNVRTRTEGIMRFPDTSENSSRARTTTYGYDALNRQVSVTQPTVKVYSGGAGDETNTVLGSMRVESDATMVSTTTYDALGNAVMNVDVAGSYSRKGYDNLGRVRFEVDALNNVTQHSYDSFGNRATTIRYASTLDTTGLSSTASWTLANIQQGVRSNALDRSLTVTYDRRNLQKKVLESNAMVFTTAPGSGGTPSSAAGETQYFYNAFGDVSEQWLLLDRAANRYAKTYFFYDRKEQVIATVDPNRFLTVRAYDVRGNLTRNHEYSVPLTSPPPWNIASLLATPPNSPDATYGYDRVTTSVYDVLGRMTSQSIANVEYASISGQAVTNQTPATQTTTFSYDAVGNRTRVTDALGNNTYTYYDVLGRVIGVVEPTRDLDGSEATTQNVTPLTTLELDVYGNVMRSTRYGDGAATFSETSFTTPSGGLRQTVTNERDVYGHVVRARDAMNFVSYASYDRRGNVAKEWRPVTNADGLVETQVKIHRYDALGREVALIEPMLRSDSQGTTIQFRAVASASVTELTAGSPEWVGRNSVWVGWPLSTLGNYRVEIDYVRRTRSGAAGGSATMGFNFTNVAGAGWLTWNDAPGGTEGGIYSVTTARVYTLDAQGIGTPITLPSGDPTHTQVSWTQTIYNAFGEVELRGVNGSEQASNGTYQEHFYYDVAGRLIRTNADDGVERIYVYDVAGRRTGEVRSKTLNLSTVALDAAVGLAVTSAMRTEMVYDDAGNLVEQRLPRFTAMGTPTTPVTKQSFDRWGNVISYTEAGEVVAGERTRRFRYSVLNNLIQTTLPVVSVLDTRNGTVPTASNVAPVLRNHYDLLGRAIGSTDANGNVNSVKLNQAGQTLKEYHADTGEKTFSYDGLGRQTLIMSEMDNWTRNNYDLDDRLTSVETEYFKQWTGSVYIRSYLMRQYGYDETGRRISETSGEVTSQGQPEKTSYFYDLTGHLIRRRSAMAYDTRYAYDVRGYKVREQNAIGGTQTWINNFWGRATAHTDMGGVSSSYGYDNAALLTQQSSTAGQNITYSYDDAGHLNGITDNPNQRLTTYGYDAAGRRRFESTWANNRQHQSATISYDALNRISGITDLRYNLTYQYDANGNRTRTFANYTDPVQAAKTQELWYTYDAMNRVKLSQGKNVGGTLTYDQTQGMRIFYRLDGLRSSVRQFSTDMLIRNVINGDVSYTTGFGDYTESYGYDSAGRMNWVYRTGEQRVGDGASPPTITPLGADTVITRQFDNASRMTREDNTRVNPGTAIFVYDDDGRLIKQTGYDLGSVNGIRTFENKYDYDGAGVLRGYNTSGFDRPTGSEHLKYTSYYDNSYLNADSYLLTIQTARTTSGSTTVLSGVATRTYNVNRELVSTQDSKETSNNRYFVNNANGEAMTVVRGNYASQSAIDSAVNTAFTQTTNTVKAHFFFFANGKATGSVGQLLGENPFSPAPTAHFDVNYTNAVQQTGPTSVAEVVAREGETLRMIAQRSLGDANLWYLIADENGLVDPDASIPAGRILRMPNTVVSLSNTADTWKPFNPADAIGDTTPTQVPVPFAGDRGCGVIGMIIVIVIAIVITVLSAGTAAGGAGAMITTATGTTAAAGSTWAAGMAALSGGLAAGTAASVAAATVGAIVGSVVSQGVGIALGVQQEFDWRAVALSAASAGIGAGIGGLATSATAVGRFAQSNPYLYASLSAAGGNAIGQGIGIALGLQKSFSWRQVAVAAVTAPISKSIGDAVGGEAAGILGGSERALRSGVQNFAMDLAQSAVGVGMRAALGEKIDGRSAVVDAFGSAIGNAIVDSGVRRGMWRDLESRAEAVGIDPEQFARVRANGATLAQVSQEIDQISFESLLRGARSSGGDSASDTGSIVSVRNGRDVDPGSADDAVGEIGLLPVYREKSASFLEMADILRTNDRATLHELEGDFISGGENSILGNLFGLLSATEFMPGLGQSLRQSAMRVFSSTEQFRQEWAQRALDYAGLMVDMADSLESKIRTRTLNDIDRAYLHGDLSGLAELDVDRVLATWKQMSFITPSKAIEAKGGLKAALLNASQTLDPFRYISEIAVGGSLAAWNTARNYSRFTEAVPQLLRRVRQEFAGRSFDNVLSSPLVQSEVEHVAALAFRFERSALRMVEQAGIRKLGKFAKILPESVQKWMSSKLRSAQGGMNTILGVLTEGAVEMALKPLVEAGFYRSMTARFKWGNDQGIDRVLTTSSGQNIFLEIKGSTGSSASFSYAQRKGAAKYIPRALGDVARYSPDPSTRNAASDLRAGLRYVPASGYAVAGLQLYSLPSKMRFEIRTWNNNVSKPKYMGL
jgi:YD repeat-containing protein